MRLCRRPSTQRASGILTSTTTQVESHIHSPNTTPFIFTVSVLTDRRWLSQGPYPPNDKTEENYHYSRRDLRGVRRP